MNPVERYLDQMHTIRASGAAVAETSYYPALANLLNAVGQTLRPQVRCVLTLKNQGAGMPDGGFFSAPQLSGGEPERGQKPERGAIEVKGAGDEVDRIVRTQQVRGYLAHYGLVLVTNYRDFALVERGADGHPVVLERYTLARDEAEFWRMAALPNAAVATNGERLVEFLQRVMQYAAPLASAGDLAWFLSSYARDALARIQGRELDALSQVREALEAALGIRFEGARGDHFFRSTLVQTLFYGIFSAWVLWSRDPLQRGKPFEWRLTPWLIHVPMIRALFEQLSLPSRLGPLGLVEVLDRAGATLNRVDREAFFTAFEEEQAVQYFYEPFLEKFDPELRKQLGVWYTPREVVRYMVERVDRVLREELGIPDGLAAEEVLVLDPAAGTGAYLVEVLKRIARTLRENGGDALLGADLKRAAMERIFGFELLPAPFVVAHLQLGLLLQQYGASLDRQEERVGVYLTNALTGWKERAQKALPLPELEDEREAAEAIKQRKKILVVLGNPPYNGYAGVAVDEERDLSDAYRTTKRAPKPQGQGLNDLYVRFYRMAERQIVERTGRGVVCFISNYSWLDGLSFTGMREHYLEVFDQIWIDNLNGDKYKTGKLTPWGEPDPSIFSTEHNREGIQVGTAIGLLLRRDNHEGTATVHYRELWGRNKRAELLESAERGEQPVYETVVPPLKLGLPFLPSRFQSNYLEWPLLPDLFPVSFPGVKTSRDDALVEIDRERLEERMRLYFDPSISHAEMARIAPRLMQKASRFDPIEVRNFLLKRGFLPENIVRYCYRPFDVRWLYWEPETKLLDEKRSDYFPHVFKGNIWIEARQRQPKEDFDRGYVVTVLADNFGSGLSSFFPLYLAPMKRDLFDLLEESTTQPRPNLSDRAAAYLDGLDAPPEALFYHAIAVMHAPAYRRENAGALRQDWPRIPLPADREALLASAALGRQVAALLDPEQPVPGVTTGPLRPELRPLGVITRDGGGQLDPATDLALTAGWGYAGRGGITMPGQGRIVEHRPPPGDGGSGELGETQRNSEEREETGRPRTDDGGQDGGPALLGEVSYDVYLNDIAYWHNVPARVWSYTLGGYQVLKKWLSYREQPLLGRPLTPEEVRTFTEIVRRIAAILLLEPALDENYRAIAGATVEGWKVEGSG